MQKPAFKPGENIAIKVPPHLYERTVAFYRDILGLEIIPVPAAMQRSVVFGFGDKRLWIDQVNGLSQAEVWLEIRTDNRELASRYFRAQGVTRRDEIEPLPEDLDGFWVASPGDIIHLIVADGAGDSG